jgi:hypothetical protein
MSSQISDTSPRRVALIAGIAYTIIVVFALFANFFVLEGLREPGDAAATVVNIANSEVLFRSGIAAFVIVFIADVVVAWGLYIIFRRTSRELSLLAAWLRLVMAAIYGSVLLNLMVAARLVGEGYPTALTAAQRNAHVMLSLDAFIYGFAIGFVFFGAHLMLLGYLIVKSGFAPRILGILVTIAGVAYAVDNFTRILFPGYESYADLFTLLVFLAIPGEFWLVGWLLWKGGKDRPTREARSTAPEDTDADQMG